MPTRVIADSHRQRRFSPRHFWAGFMRLTTLARSRQHLSRLDDHLLRDIGLTPSEARTEAIQPIWDVPPHWRR